MAEYTIPLSDLRRSDLALAGGKGANLGELIRAGLPVPSGFCLSTAAYRLAAATPEIRSAIGEVAAAADDAARTSAAARVRAAILDSAVPQEVARACAAALAELGDAVPVAVRSSATAEDQPDASFAGQQDTYLGLRGQEEVLDAVRRCWASLFSERATAYRAERGIDPRAVEIALVVQVLVPASVAGVLFTADPVLGRRGRAVIDASPGLGEAVVSGAVNPDHFEIEGGRVVDRRIGDKRLRIDAVAGGTEQVALAPSAEPCVTEAELHDLVALGRRIEAHFGAPQDIEWALDSDRRPIILQARPITTLYPLPADAPMPPGLAVYFNFNVAQGVLQPLTPMGLQCWRLFVGAILARAGLLRHDEPDQGPSFVKSIGHRLFFDITTALRHPLGRRIILAAFSRMEARSAAVLSSLAADPRLALVPASPWSMARHLLPALWRTRLPLRFARAARAPGAARARAWAAADAALALGSAPADAPARQQLAALEAMLLGGGPELVLNTMPTFATGFIALQLARRLLGADASADEMETVMRALPHNITTEMDLELWAMSRRVAADDESAALLRATPAIEIAARYRAGGLPATLRRELDPFLARYGARGVAEIDVGVARWGEDPSQILSILTNYLALGDPALAPDRQFERARAAAEAMAATLVQRARRRGRLRGRLVELALGRARELAGMREAPKFFIVRLLYRARELLLGIGRELVAKGRLAAVDDTFLLDLPELRSAIEGADLRRQADVRRASMARERDRRRIPRVLLSDGTDAESLLIADQPAGSLIGTPASAGRVTGRARVVMDPAGACIEPGEILVAPSTDPGWTPLFLTAGGLVMEMGGAMSHGAVVAREYGIPAVVGLPQATARLQTGQWITVDGGAGTVTVGEAVGPDGDADRVGVEEQRAIDPGPRRA